MKIFFSVTLRTGLSTFFALKASEKFVFHERRLVSGGLFYTGQCTVQRNTILRKSAFSHTR